jgi:hypothetical protein
MYHRRPGPKSYGEKKREDASRRKMIARSNFAVAAWVQFDGDMNALKAALPPEKIAELIKADDFFAQTFTQDAGRMLEYFLIQNMMELGTTGNAQAITAAKVLLPALNKRRYNQGVQRQEVANAGVEDFLRLVNSKMTKQQVVNIMVNCDPQFLGAPAEQMKMLTLEEAHEIELAKPAPIEVEGITEDEDLAA